MKKLAVLLFTIIFSTLSFSQTEQIIADSSYSQTKQMISNALSSIEREPSYTNNLYLRGSFLKEIKNGRYAEFINAYHQKGFSKIRKSQYLNNVWQRSICANSDSTIKDQNINNVYQKSVIASSDSIIIALFDEIRRGLPADLSILPTEVDEYTVIDDYFTDVWRYTNSDGKKCFLMADFINGQLRTLGYSIRE